MFPLAAKLVLYSVNGYIRFKKNCCSYFWSDVINTWPAQEDLKGFVFHTTYLTSPTLEGRKFSSCPHFLKGVVFNKFTILKHSHQ